MKSIAHPSHRLGLACVLSRIFLMVRTRNIYGYNSFFYRVWRFLVA